MSLRNFYHYSKISGVIIRDTGLCIFTVIKKLKSCNQVNLIAEMMVINTSALGHVSASPVHSQKG